MSQSEVLEGVVMGREEVGAERVSQTDTLHLPPSQAHMRRPSTAIKLKDCHKVRSKAFKRSIENEATKICRGQIMQNFMSHVKATRCYSEGTGRP